MWRQNASAGDQDSDRSISDDDGLDRPGYDCDCSESLRSLYSHGKKTMDDFLSECDIEVQGLCSGPSRSIQPRTQEDHRSVSVNESISDEDTLAPTELSFAYGASRLQANYNTVQTDKNDEASTWSEVLEEVNELACLPKLPPKVPSNSGVSRRRHKGRTSLKFSFRSHSHEESWPCALKDRNEKCYDGHSHEESWPCALKDRNENCYDGERELPIEFVPHEKKALPSMAELLEDLNEKNDTSIGTSNLAAYTKCKSKGKKANSSSQRSLPQLGQRVLDDEDPLEYMACGSSSEDEDIDPNHLSLGTQKLKGQTMTDLFQEAFSASNLEGLAVPTIKLAETGYWGRLQQVLQIEKDKHLEFSRQFHGGKNSFNNSRGIIVQILSRSLEGKLTVCRCLVEDTEFSLSAKCPRECAVADGTWERTIIFSSKICDNVDLGVGNLVCLYSPWKEVLVKNDEKIILCTYFSHIMT
ncbi:uncharacterized protein [Typha angustifolia]|uniref:uncharacterized protein isoform X2 n=1 Tax=Typha angustifolia TaxID=59011 RepID=UPI003C2FB34B